MPELLIPSPDIQFLIEEARLRGSKPVVRIIISPYPHPPGVDGTGVFDSTYYISLAEIRAYYDAFATGSWTSAVLANLGEPPSTATFTWDWNSPGYELTVSWRSAATAAALAAKAWTTIESGGTAILYDYYQWKFELVGYRAWAIDDKNIGDSGESWYDSGYVGDSGYIGDSMDPNESTAWAEDTANEDRFQGYAADENHEGDPLTYVKNPELLGEYPVPGSDIVWAGTFSERMSEDFGLVAGSHDGLVFNNRHGKYNELKSTFFLGHVPDWWDEEYEVLVKAGYQKRDTREKLLVEVYRGILGDWGPATRQAGQPHNIEVYSTNKLAQLMEARIGYDSDGKPWPIFYGSYLAEAKKITGKTLDPPLKTIGFEANNFNEVDHLVATGGGALSIISSLPLRGTYSARCSVAGANQSALMQMESPSPGTTMFPEISMRFTTAPAIPVANNLTFLRILDTADVERLNLKVGASDGTVYANAVATDWNILATPGQREISIRLGPTKLTIWQDGNEVYSLDYTPGVSLKTLELGATTGASAETWDIDYDYIRIGNTYYDNCFQVDGWPFDSIDIVYLDDLAQRDYDIGPPATGRILAKYPEYGAVTMRDTVDSTADVSGTVKFKITANTTVHPVDQIEDAITLVGADSYINAASFAAAKLLIPDYVTGCRFDGGSKAGDIIQEIAQHCLINVFMGLDIRVLPYLGTAPAAPSPLLPRINQFTSKSVLEAGDELREVQTLVRKGELNTRIGKKRRVKARVTATWGNYERQPDLTYVAGDAAGDGEELDFTYESPVASENAEMVKALADIYLKFLGPKRPWGPVRLSHRGLRLEAGDSVQVNETFLMDEAMNFMIAAKEISLDPPRETTLQIENRLRET